MICPYCEGKQVVKRGLTDTGKQRYRCQNEQCSHQSFLLDPAYKGRLPAVKQQVIERLSENKVFGKQPVT